MSPLLFKDSFWGSEFTCHTGYDVIIQRLKDGRQMCKDVEELLKMRAVAEERYGKELLSISHKAGGHTEISTLRASFEQLKTQIENVGSFHMQLSEALREEVKKMETFRERQKEQRKKLQSIMEKVQKKKVSSYKKTIECKKIYEMRCKEADESEQNTVSCRNTDKGRHRAKHCRQAAGEAEKLYLSNIVQLESDRQDWEETHRSTCEVFQQLEGDRISMLRLSLWDQCNHYSIVCVNEDESYEEVRKQLEKCDITTDNNWFIESKGTGHAPPDPIVFESFYQTEPSTDMNNGRAHLTQREREGDNMRCSDSLLSGSESFSLGSHHSARTPSGGSDSDRGYSPLPPTDTLDGENFLVNFDYTAKETDELSVYKGETVRVFDKGEDGWWFVENESENRGVVPGNFLSKI